MRAGIAVSHQTSIREHTATRHAPVGYDVGAVGYASTRDRNMEQKRLNRGDFHPALIYSLGGTSSPFWKER